MERVSERQRGSPHYYMVLVHEHIAGIDCVYYGWFKLSYRVVVSGISDPRATGQNRRAHECRNERCEAQSPGQSARKRAQKVHVARVLGEHAIRYPQSEVHPGRDDPHMMMQSLSSSFPVVIPISSNVCGPGFGGACASGLDTSGCPLFCRLGCGLDPGPPAPTPALFAPGGGADAGDAEREPGSTRLYRGALAKGRMPPPGAGDAAGDRCGCDALGGNACGGGCCGGGAPYPCGAETLGGSAAPFGGG